LRQNLCRAFVLAVALLAVPHTARAQQAGARPAAAVAPSPAVQQMQDWLAELQQIGQRLVAAQQRALEDATLRTRQAAITRELDAAMLRADPGLAAAKTRMRALQAEAQQAQHAADQPKLTRLHAEALRIEARIVAAQRQVLQDAALVARVRSFESDLNNRVLQVEPHATQLIQRADTLRARLEAAARQQQGAGPRR
jgi:hypothetical protein